MDKVYAIMYNSYEVDDLDYGDYHIIYLSLNKDKRDKVFENLRHKNMCPDENSPFFKYFEPKENKKGHFSFYYGKWCYQYKLEKFNLEDETKIF